MTTLAVIPARWGSARFPGKPLASIAGRTLLERAIDLGRRSLRHADGATLVVATDDVRIADHARGLGCDAVMTDPAIVTGSGRVLAAAQAWPTRPDYVLNLQGDAPFLSPATVNAVLIELIASGAECVTPLVLLGWSELDDMRTQKLRSPSSGTTCVRAGDGSAIWFSKQILPQIRHEAALRASAEPCPVLRHLGLYGYSLATLEKFEAAAGSAYERLEGLEQLRLIEIGVRIRTVLVERQPIPIGGIDTPDDALLAERLIADLGDPYGT